MSDIGADINSSWVLNEKGDLEIVSDEENLIQSIVNRFNCWLNTFDLYYFEYGSILSSFIGWKRNQESLDLMRLEIENTLNQEPRFNDYELDIFYDDEGIVNIILSISFNGENIDLNLVITEDGSVKIDDSIDDTEDTEEEEE